MFSSAIMDVVMIVWSMKVGMHALAFVNLASTFALREPARKSVCDCAELKGPVLVMAEEKMGLACLFMKPVHSVGFLRRKDEIVCHIPVFEGTCLGRTFVRCLEVHVHKLTVLPPWS